MAIFSAKGRAFAFNSAVADGLSSKVIKARSKHGETHGKLFIGRLTFRTSGGIKGIAEGDIDDN